jgi:signal transduction histidine kinase
MIQAAIFPDDRASVEAVIGRAYEGRPFDLVFRLVSANGGLRHVHVIAHRDEQLADRVVFIGALQDVTESKLAEAALKASEAELRAAYSQLSMAQRVSATGSFTWDVDLDAHNWSEETYRIWEFDPDTPINIDRILAAIHSEDLPLIETAMAGAMDGEGFDVVFRIVTPRGTVKHIHGVAQRMAQITDRIVYIGATQDVTEGRRAEEALDRARAELTHVARFATLSTLTASIAHEVNQPLTGITTNANTCLRMLALEPPDLDGARATVQRALRDGRRAAEVITRLRALFSKRASPWEAVDLNDATREVLAIAASELQRARVTVRTSLAERLPPVVGDRVQLQQVILNLLLNGADAMAGVAGRTRELTVASARDGRDRLRLSVRDAGMGVAAGEIEKLFEPFHTTKATGMGIGLSISRSIIESHRGRLWAEPNDDAGATFAFTIPLQPAEAQAAVDDDAGGGRERAAP